jgi:hypothetical protein
MASLMRSFLVRLPTQSVVRSFSGARAGYASQPPPLDKPAADEGEVFINKAAQRLLWVSYRLLQPDYSHLSLDEALHSTQWLLPTPAQLKPSEKLKAFLATPQTNAAAEARRQEMLSGGKLGAKYGKFPSFQSVLNLLKQGYTLDQAIVLKYYQKYPPPQDNVVTLVDIYARINDDEWVYDPVIGELTDVWKVPTEEDIARVEEADPVVGSYLRTYKFQSSEEFNRKSKEFLELHDFESQKFDAPIPTQEQINAMPLGSLERSAHTQAREQYNRYFVKPLEAAADRYQQALKGLSEFERKAAESYASKSIAEWRKKHAANDAKPEYATQFKGDSELAAKVSALIASLEKSQH